LKVGHDAFRCLIQFSEIEMVYAKILLFFLGFNIVFSIVSAFQIKYGASFGANSIRMKSVTRSIKISMIDPLSDIVSNIQVISDTISSHHLLNGIDSMFHNTMLLSDEDVVQATQAATSDISVYSKVDKTGFIGFLADYVEQIIDLAHDLIKGLGIQNSYGPAIILFTFLGKLLIAIVSNTTKTLC